MSNSMKIVKVLVVACLMSHSAIASSYSHSAIDHSRSSYDRNIFVTLGLDGEYGKITSVPAGGESNTAPSSIWRGYGIRNSLGLELMKFVQFSVSHSLLNLRSKDSGLDTLQGSRFSADARLVFASPIGNVEVGGGAVASRYDYQSGLTEADFMGSGYYHTAGLNYFLTPQVSVFGNVRANYENLTRSGGDASLESLRLNTRGVMLGFKLWL